MLNFIKPGHLLRFGTCPSTIPPPAGVASPATNDNTEADLWPDTRKTLGNVRCVSHPSGPVGSVCADVATAFRDGGHSKRRAVSYSAVGRAFGSSNRAVGSANADFVGYTDGRTNYVRSANMVFSKDFSGCLMVVYTEGGRRHVAHAAASKTPKMDCKQAFLTRLQRTGATLTGWFRPYEDATDGVRKVACFGHVSKYVGGNINRLTTFGVVNAGHAYAIDAFRPTNGGAGEWVVTAVIPKTLSTSFRVT